MLKRGKVRLGEVTKWRVVKEDATEKRVKENKLISNVLSVEPH